MPVLRNLVYARTADHSLSLDLYLPENVPYPMPLIVWIHGGAWRVGDKGFPPAALPLMKDGFAVASVGYRFSQHAIFPAQILDVKAAVRWLRQHAAEYRLDPHRFAAWGPSAGGHLAALLGVSFYMREWDNVIDYEECAPPEFSSSVQAVIDWFGPTDLLRMDDQPGDSSHNAPDSPESQLIGAPIQSVPERSAAANPIRYVYPTYPPFLICHGQDDRTVIPSQSVLLYEALQRWWVDSRLELLPGEGHGFSPAQTAWAVEQARVFLEQKLKDLPRRVFYACTTENFRPRTRHKVRWLNPHKDYPLARAYWLTGGSGDLSEENWQEAHNLGYSYAAVVDGEDQQARILSIAAVLRYSEAAWELAAVSTNDPELRRKGYSTSVCSFVTQYILGTGRIATVSTGITNEAMQKTAEKIGFLRVG